MAKEKTPNPTIIVDGVSREMTKSEFDSYKLLATETQDVMSAEFQAKQKKEEAIAKLVALGLNENDIKAMGI